MRTMAPQATPTHHPRPALSHTCQELDTFFGAAANPENNEKRQLSHSGQTLEAASYTAVSTRNNFNRPALGGISFAADSYQRPQSAHLEQHLSDTSPHDDAGVDSLSVEQQQQQRHAGPHLTHIDSSGSASMVDVSQVRYLSTPAHSLHQSAVAGA